MIRVALGTKEYISVDVTDITGVTTTLVGTTPQFDVLDAAGAALISNQAATATLMNLLCLCDFSNTGTFPIGDYRLFIEFTVGAEAPRLGPFNIQIVSTILEG
jgi:hypothetical protein